MTKILVVDDEPLIVESLIYSLEREGFQVMGIGDGSMVLETVQEYQPDLIVLDILLPGMNGIEVCKRLRARSTIPIIMLTARGDEVDRVLGLEVGADDYLPKPFSFRELLARIRALLRRVEMDRYYPPLAAITIGDLHLDLVARRLTKKGQEIQLSAREYELLSFLMRNAGRAISRKTILAQVWGEEWIGDERTLDVHIRWLRLKIEDDPALPFYLQTVRGYGYRFIASEETG
ncbi:MAG: response regulator transcription factor [Anaerolineales bacterium]|nr:response regulator transcription factor [Anaerolineales bacterium]MCS7248760.1 response regulator transcription factor [Anaerolineales bacterium]MDW8162573.1 response regulator transcription factor [Anaerolineales bacterium]MDW8446335.1 response regulator transcription factor [Anaerolineales bacterium]